MDVHRTVNVHMGIMSAPNAEQIRHIGFVIANAIMVHVVKMRIVLQTIAQMVFVHLAVPKVAFITATAQCVLLVINVNHGQGLMVVGLNVNEIVLETKCTLLH